MYPLAEKTKPTILSSQKCRLWWYQETASQELLKKKEKKKKTTRLFYALLLLLLLPKCLLKLRSDMTFRFRKIWVFFFFLFFLKALPPTKKPMKSKQTKTAPTQKIWAFLCFSSFPPRKKETKKPNTRQNKICRSILHAFVDDFHLLAWLWKKWENCQAPNSLVWSVRATKDDKTQSN